MLKLCNNYISNCKNRINFDKVILCIDLLIRTFFAENLK